jgi:hypothetical protein
MNIRLFLLQSEQLLLASSLTKLFNVARFCSARSAAGLGRRDIMRGAGCGVLGDCSVGIFVGSEL